MSSEPRKLASGGYHAYVGAGAHSTPPAVLTLMTTIARYMASQGYVLRSGGSPGADVAFETGCGSGPKEIFLPYAGFNKNRSPLVVTPELRLLIHQHPVWQALRAALAAEDPPTELSALPHETLQLYARDVLQVLGRDLATPAERVLYWTPPGVRDGTRITLYIAAAAGVPTEDLCDAHVAACWGARAGA